MKQAALLLLVASISIAADARPRSRHGPPSGGPGLKVRATDSIFAAGFTGKLEGGATQPAFIAVTPGQKLAITATGRAFCCGRGGNSAGPDGFAKNPFGTGSKITNNLGTQVGTFEDAVGAFALLGVFAGDNDDHTPFKIGSRKMLTVPRGASKLYFGYADANGFNGEAGAYYDNSGVMTVSVRKEP